MYILIIVVWITWLRHLILSNMHLDIQPHYPEVTSCVLCRIDEAAFITVDKSNLLLQLARIDFDPLAPNLLHIHHLEQGDISAIFPRV